MYFKVVYLISGLFSLSKLQVSAEKTGISVIINSMILPWMGIKLQFT